MVKDSIEFIFQPNSNVPKLDPTIITAIKKYTNGNEFHYDNINKCLRNSDGTYIQSCETVKSIIKTLSDLSNRFPRTTGEIIVYRTIKKWNFNPKEFFGQMPLGSIYEDRTFMSTSLKLGFELESYDNPIVLKIHLPKNTPCLYLDPISEVKGEKEVLLPSGYSMILANKSSIEFRGNTFPLYEFDCNYCSLNKRYSISIPPTDLNLTTERRESQPQDKKLDQNRLGLDYLKYYNRIIPKDTNVNLRVMSWNINEWKNDLGFQNNGTKRDIVEVINKIDPDFIGLQRVAFPQTIIQQSDDEKTKLNQILGTKLETAAVCKDTHNLYNALLYKKNEFKPTKYETVDIGDGSCAGFLETKVNGKDIAIITIYLDVNNSKKRVENLNQLYDKLIKQLIQKELKNIIILGNFNSYREADYNKDQLDKLKEFKSSEWPNIFEATKKIKEMGFVESFNKFNQEYPINTAKSGGRVDFIYVYKKWEFGRKVRAYTHYGSQSSHLPIILDFSY